MKLPHHLIKKKRIVIAVTYFPPHIGGVEHYTKNFFGALSKRYPNLEITIVTLDWVGAPSEEHLSGMRIIRIPAFGFDINPFFNFSAVRRGLDRAGLGTCDLFITQCRYYFFTYYVGSLAKRNGIPIVHIEHNAGYMTHRNCFVSRIAWLYEICISPIVLKRARCIVAISESVRSFLEKSFQKKQVEVLYGGVDTEIWKPAPKDSPMNKPTFVFCGRLLKEKGVYTLLDAFEQIVPEYPMARLLYIGEGDEKKQLIKAIQKRGIASYVEVLGMQSPEVIREIYTHFPFFVNPSEYSEGLQVAVLEAAASGLAIVTTPVGGTQEILENEKSALFVPPGSVLDLVFALKRLLRDTELSEKLGRTARESVVGKVSLQISIQKFYHYFFKENE